MAAIKPTVTDVSIRGNESTYTVVWTPVTEADTCVAVQMPEYADRSIQVSGTFGGASVAVQGSNDGTNFAALRDPSSTTIAITTAGIRAVLENTYQTKPVATGGTSQSLTIAMLFHLSHPFRT